MAEAMSGGSDGERERSKPTSDSSESSPFRKLCEHYSRGCSFIVSVNFRIQPVISTYDIINLGVRGSQVEVHT